jgi:hypothetical protein
MSAGDSPLAGSPFELIDIPSRRDAHAVLRRVRLLLHQECYQVALSVTYVPHDFVVLIED